MLNSEQSFCLGYRYVAYCLLFTRISLLHHWPLLLIACILQYLLENYLCHTFLCCSYLNPSVE